MKYLVFALLVFSSAAFAQTRLYVFDCGSLRLDSLAIFGLEEHESDVREMFVPCYLIEHARGRLLWDGGLPESVADANGDVALEGGSMAYRTWIVDQLAAMGIAPGQIDHVAYSHLHFDHAGAANAFVDTNVIMQRQEWDAAFGASEGFVDTSLFDAIKPENVTFIDGDHDVFGDGTVRLIFAPGHTPGHQLLLVELENTGRILLSGDLYHTRANRRLRKVPTFNHDAAQTLQSMDKIEALLAESGATLWIEHDKALADTLNKAPAYYD
jgi:glyoxylase-like metal-dependent hydrolase (beta-lactamase superfamily II)